VNAATKQALIDLVDSAVAADWTVTAACAYLSLPTVRYYRWAQRAADDQLTDHPPGGHPVHGILAE
jgi:putative transposase